MRLPLLGALCLLSVVRCEASLLADISTSAAQRQIPAVRIASPPVIDGAIGAEEWAGAARAERFFDQQTGEPTADQTAAYIAYDDEHIYVAIYAYDSKPEFIVGRETVRDSRFANEGGGGDGEDSVEVSFDTFFSSRWDDQTRFSVNPLGTPSARISGGRAAKREWQGDWQAAARRLPDGWSVEMRIPWRMLNYPNSSTPVTMGINFRRFQHRTRINSIWSNTGPQRFLDLQGRWVGVRPPQRAFAPEVSALPYVLAGLERGTGHLRSGLDVRALLTPELTSVVTVNPDFGTVEGAVEGIQFSRSERFVEERRPFFLEGRGYFQAGQWFGAGPYFYPNRIRAMDLGAKIFGKLSPRDSLGLLATADFGREANAVVNYRHTYLPTASFGAFFTQKSTPGLSNTVLVGSHDRRWGKLGVSTDAGVSAGHEAGGAVYEVGVRYEDKVNFSVIRALSVAEDFLDANGFVYFTDMRGFDFHHSWGSPWRSGFFRGFEVSGGGQYKWHMDGRPYMRGGSLGASIETRSDWAFSLSYDGSRFDDAADETIGGRIIWGESNRFRRVSIGGRVGRLDSRPASFYGIGMSFRLLRRLDVAYSANVQNLDGSEQLHIATFTYELSPTRSIGGRVVKHDSNTNWYLSYRHSGDRGTETYILLGDPNASRFREQAVVKMVFAL